MSLSSQFVIRVRNFGCFIDSQSFTISPGINTLIGINNAGKTALLFALASLSSAMRTKQFPYPYFNLNELLKRYQRPEGDPIIEVAFPIAEAREQILQTLCGLASQPKFPEKGDVRDSLKFLWVLGPEMGLVNIYSRTYQGNKPTEKELLRLTTDPAQPTVSVVEHPYGFDRPDSYRPPKFDVILLTGRTELRPFKFKETLNQLAQLWPSLFESLVLLSTHRNPPARAQHSYAVALDPVASNLPQVLATIQMSTPDLQDGREIFDVIQDHLKLLFPEVRRVRTEIVPGDRTGQPLEVEVKLDLNGGSTVSLSHSGTGIQQVLALLTGAFVRPNGSLFLLDEPHSYLHPAAERGLIKILERLGRERGHYFCVATHSPIFASHSRKRLYAVRATQGKGSTVNSLSQAADILDTLGVSNPDLFTYNRVIFVEGQSDEKVIRMISEMGLDPKSDYRLKIQPLGGDGLLKNRSRAEFIRLLHNANASEIHVPLRFVLDSHDWSNIERQKLSSLLDSNAQQVVHFLKLPELENYLLDAEAIVYALRQRLTGRNGSHHQPDAGSVKKILEAKRGEKGSAVLEEIFGGFECDYSKNKDVEALLSFIEQNCPQHLDPLLAELSDVLGMPSASNKPSAKQVGTEAAAG